MEEGFRLLEDRIQKAAARLKELQAEARGLRSELAEAKTRAEKAERRIAEAGGGDGDGAEERRKAEALAREVKTLRREREEIHSRIARLVELLEGLD
jgi:predicted RNase H-like nuclease (RuvC/YqgF family)